jgi:mono/diheme cytochrome c family protein
MSANGEDRQQQPHERAPSLWLVLAMPVSLVLTVFALGFGLLAALELEDGAEATPATTTETTQPGGNEEGAAVFESQNCGGCHTLSAAGSTGITGPNLDETQLSEAEIAAVVTNGRGEGMPAFGESLDSEEIASVAAYVSESAASP